VGALMSRLMKIADEYNVAVVITNQARARASSVALVDAAAAPECSRACRRCAAAAPAGDG
jgi:hypothetical protein